MLPNQTNRDGGAGATTNAIDNFATHTEAKHAALTSTPSDHVVPLSELFFTVM